MRLIVRFLIWLARKLSGESSTKSKEHSSQFEVEKKFRLSSKEAQDLPAKLIDEGFRYFRKQDMTDTFLPAKEESDMIRVRDLTDESGSRIILTLKKWTVVDGERVRQERETESLDPVTRECLLDLGMRLAKDDLISFSKVRVEYQKRVDGRVVTVALDEVEGLGANSGSYIEVEVLAKRKEDVKQASAQVDEIARFLLGDDREMASSYMEMLQKHHANSP